MRTANYHRPDKRRGAWPNSGKVTNRCVGARPAQTQADRGPSGGKSGGHEPTRPGRWIRPEERQVDEGGEPEERRERKERCARYVPVPRVPRRVRAGQSGGSAEGSADRYRHWKSLCRYDATSAKWLCVMPEQVGGKRKHRWKSDGKGVPIRRNATPHGGLPTALLNHLYVVFSEFPLLAVITRVDPRAFRGSASPEEEHRSHTLIVRNNKQNPEMLRQNHAEEGERE